MGSDIISKCLKVPENDKNRQILEWVGILKKGKVLGEFPVLFFDSEGSPHPPAHLQHTGDENVQSYWIEDGDTETGQPQQLESKRDIGRDKKSPKSCA